VLHFIFSNEQEVTAMTPNIARAIVLALFEGFLALSFFGG
jgi:hypothetical protein